MHHMFDNEAENKI